MSQRESPRARGAYEAYAAMGRGRSLAKLHRHLSGTTPEKGDCASLDGLKYWSRTYGWAGRVAEHDARVAAEVQEKAVESQVRERVDALRGMDTGIALCVGLLEDVIAGKRKIEVLTPQDVRAVIAALAEASKHRELLEGRATERFAHLTEDELEAELRRLHRELADQGVDLDGPAATRH